MDIDDIPILRHLKLAGGILQVVAILSGYLIFPGLALYAHDGYHNRSYSVEAKWHFGLKAAKWWTVMWMFTTFMQCLWTNLIGGPDPMEGHWFFFSWPYSWITHAQGSDWFWNEMKLCSTIIGITWISHAILGKENSSGDFITHESYDEGLRKVREKDNYPN